MRRLALILALLMPVAIDGALLAEVKPVVSIARVDIALNNKDLPRLFDALSKLKPGETQKEIDILKKILKIFEKTVGLDHQQRTAILRVKASILNKLMSTKVP